MSIFIWIRMNAMYSIDLILNAPHNEKNLELIFQRGLDFEFIKLAEEHDAPCLQFIDVTGDTLFSEKQMLQIRDELFDLKCDPRANLDIIKIIERGTDEALLENFDYLKFQGL